MMTAKEIEVQIALGTLSIGALAKLARSRRTSKKVLNVLSTNKYWHVRYRVADNLSTPINILRILSKDKSWRVRYYVAYNPNTPIDILKKLSTDKNGNVRNNADWATQTLKER